MLVRTTRRFFVLALIFLAAGIARPVRAALPTPNQPILVVQDSNPQDSNSLDPYQKFIPELLTTEGLNGFQTAELGDLTSTFLTPANFDVVILPHLALTSDQAALFQSYVNAGGTLIGFRPDLQLASVFGVAPLNTTLAEAWLKIDTTTQYGSALVNNVLRFHGTADLYSLNGASALANLYTTSTLSTTSPAAAINTFGSGKAILFSFDLTQSIVLMRQGNPAWAGYPNNHDGNNTMRASQMFMDQGSGKFWNDLGDGALNDLPQADIELRLFSNALTLTNATKQHPLPRFWYYPNQSRSLVLMTGDHHGDDVNNSISEINAVQTAGGKFSEFLWYPFGTISASQVNTWLTAGHSMGIHFDDTAEIDSSGVGGSAASWAGMNTVMTNALTSFKNTFSGAPAPVTTRDHFLIWVSNDANGTVDQVANAKLFQANNIQFDTSYSSFPNRWGYMTGSGLPMKFLDTAPGGSVISVYEQSTQYEDDVQLSTDAYSVDWDLPTAQRHYQQTLSDSLTKYNTVTTFLFHPDHWADYQSYAQTVLQYAQSNSIPMFTTGDWLNFWKSRATTTVSKPSFTSNVLSFTATGSPAGLTLLVPNVSGTNNLVSTFKVDGVSQSFTVAAYQGVMDAGVILTAGTHAISVTYIPAGRILGQITPSAAAASTTIQVQGGSISQSVSVAADGTYVVGPLPAGTYTVTPTSSGYFFTPTSKSVTLAAADVTGVNFAGTVNSAGQTLFTTQTPAVTNASDGAGVNYELGTVFTSAAPGQITAVRFWKATGETGTHTGHIWTSTGTLLASVTFTGETSIGWQQQALATPIAIAANTQYVVSVNTGNTLYVATTGGLATQVVNGNLKSVVGNNGLYGSTGVFPTNSFQTSNYFRDVVFVAGATFNITGSVSPAASGVGTTLTLSGPSSATATADASGNYSFLNMPNGTYTITPAKAGFTFSPTSASATVSNANVTVTTFTATPLPTFTASGTITPAASGNGATVKLTLGATTIATASANSLGAYTFTGLSNGNYTVTPTKAGFTFSPTSAAANVNNANVSVVNFAASVVPTFTISGAITPAANGPGTTVTLTLSGTTISTTNASATGSFSFVGIPAGNYTVTPTQTGFTYTPASAAANVVSANVSVGTFTAAAIPPGQSLFTTQTPAVTNASDGFNVNYELGTALTSITTGQITAVRFWKATGETGTHTGRIWSSTGTLLVSVVFTGETATGWQQQALATPLSIAANTQYVVSVNTGNTLYVATTGGLATQVVNGNLKSVVGNNGLYASTGVFPTNSFQTSNYFRDVVFIAGATFNVTGSVPTTTSGATLTLSGPASATTTADVSGNYTFTGVANGTYTITPTKAGFVFSPTSAQAIVNNGNVTVPPFTASPVPTFSVSGTITPTTAGSGTSVKLTLSGTTIATVTADTSGNYTFPGLANGNYTVIPTKTGVVFTPASAAANVNNANVTAVNFAASATQTLFTTQTPVVTNASDGSNVNYELGTSFTSIAAGQITAVRFWKAASETGTHTGRIWSSTGTLLASVVFTGETASGWQQQLLATPLTITANTQYVVSVNTGNTFYVATDNGLASQIVNGNLRTVAGNNGLYGSTGVFPTNSYLTSNYFRDIVFVPSP